MLQNCSVDCKDMHKREQLWHLFTSISRFERGANTEGFVESELVYYLLSSEMLVHFYGLWGMIMDSIMKPSTDAKLRLLGLLLTMEKVR